ncbi:hypothetical protein B0T26DRAFT_865327 [Lasiosphaeria miniovina]|uniref:FAD-binding PCMH-type domain-containing protein n=1 Tax=Lasiosphaeria miniovina TaxID=1954250 RepID=A0AA39ZQ83_9PEZI|nr:uncharacterized protein B0T26DRAFT_865327 [Lasiosphaeria miniovina]KAK0701574.1 hypothetical protein B0T26DRAFT_865327 [Lasiosphaeria miniovina]
MVLTFLTVVAVIASIAEGLGFDFFDADLQLTEQDIHNFKAIEFASAPASEIEKTNPRCKNFPGDGAWPTETEWSQLNSSVGGALLKPVPPASVCYHSSPAFNEAACNFLLNNASRTSFYFDDPVTIFNYWAQGNTCLPAENPTGNCTQGGYPVYVVNATSVKQVQAAVNFARNRNIRLVIKNTGHESVGRNAGAGSLSIWTHHLKTFKFLPDYKQPEGNYHGPAARVGAGLQAWEAFRQALKLNITLTAASCVTVGSYGGWISGGGHSPLSSKFGLGADQVLSIQAVTADGRYITADPQTNQDMFFALRGGGGSTFGVITSVIVKAHPPINLTIASFTFTLGSSLSTEPGPSVTITDKDTFWKGFNTVFQFGITTVDAGGYLWTFGIPITDVSIQMQVQVQMPGQTPTETAAFVKPLLTSLNTIGIPVAITNPTTIVYSNQTGPISGGPGNGRFASRLFPRRAYQSPTLFNAAMAAARAAIEGGYLFHGLNMAPTLRAAGFPASAGVNPVWREAVMHADMFDPTSLSSATPAEAEAAHTRLNAFMAPLRAATPGGGAYLNEADLEEPNWQQSFFGTNYERLLQIKRLRDPWQVFWAPATVGSEDWIVTTPNQVPSQNGRLCRVSGES